MGKTKTQTQTSTPDAGTMDWIQRWRDAISGVGGGLGIPGLPGGFDVPGGNYDEVRDIIRETAGLQREGAGTAANQAATGVGAYGGSRHGILQGQLIGDVNRSEREQLASLGMSEADRAWNQIMQTLSMMGGASQVGGNVTTNKTQGNALGGLLGLGTTIAGIPGIGSIFGGGGNEFEFGNAPQGAGGSGGIYGSRPGTSYYGGY